MRKNLHRRRRKQMHYLVPQREQRTLLVEVCLFLLLLHSIDTSTLHRLDGKWSGKQAKGVTSGCLSTVPGCGLEPWITPTPAPVPTPPPAPLTPSTQENQNGAYFLTNTPHGNLSKFPTNYKDYPGGVYSFDILSPVVSTLYSQVLMQ